MPVYNGERFIEEAIESILAQSFEDFELVILDNASTDRTEDICKRFSASDSRVRYLRNRSNYGIVNNFNSVFRLSSGEFFKWASSDDICAPDFLKRCVEILDGDRSVVLAYPRHIDIDEDGRRVAANQLLPDIDMNSQEGSFSTDPLKRFRVVMRHLGFTEQLYGLMRTDALAKTGLHAQHFNGDHILLAELCLHGRFFEIREDLFFRRVHAAMTTARVPTLRLRVANVDVSPQDNTGFLWWRLLRPYPRRLWWHALGVGRAPLTRRQRMLCYAEVARTAVVWAGRRSAEVVGSSRRAHQSNLPAAGGSTRDERESERA